MQLTASLVTERKALPHAGFCHHQHFSFCFHLIAKQPPYNAETVADTQMLKLLKSESADSFQINIFVNVPLFLNYPPRPPRIWAWCMHKGFEGCKPFDEA